jgi:predicted dehydrogenase
MTSDRLRVALAGSADELVPLLAALRELGPALDAAVVALSAGDRKDPILRAELEHLDERPSLYLRLEEVLANETVHVVCIATPVPRRHAHAVASLYAGCHVLVKAPLALTVRGAIRAVESAQENDRILAVWNSGRFSREVQVLRWALSSQIVGRLQYVCDIAFGHAAISPNLCFGGDPKRHDRAHGGGLLLAEAVHDLAFLRFACGDIVEIAGHEMIVEPERLLRDASGAVAQRFACYGEDTVAAQLRFANGACGQYLRSWGGRGLLLDRRFNAWGSAGAIENGMVYPQRGDPCELESEWKERVGPGEIEKLFPGGVTDPLRLELLSFFSALRSAEAGKPVSPPHDGREALRDLATAWTAGEAARHGTRLTVSNVENLAVENAQKQLNARWNVS